MSHFKSIAFLLLVVSLAVLGWIRKKFAGEDNPLFYVAYWEEGGKGTVYYPIADSSHFQRLGNCVAISEEKGEKWVFCRNYKLLSPEDKRRIGRLSGKSRLIPAYMREK